MSERVEKRLAALLDHPHFDPYGNPIPGLSELGEETTRVAFLDGVVPLVADGRAVPDGKVTVVRIAEPLQVDVELLTRLAEVGVQPGGELVVERGDGLMTVGAPGAESVLDLPDEVARHIFVAV